MMTIASLALVASGAVVISAALGFRGFFCHLVVALAAPLLWCCA